MAFINERLDRLPYEQAPDPEEDTLPATIDIEAEPGAGEAIEKLYRNHYGLVFRTAYRITGRTADAEDVLQTVFLRLARRDRDAPAVEQAASYLHRAAVNAALDVVRARREMQSVPLDDAMPAGEVSPERLRGAAEIQHWLRGAIARLSPRAAEMFVLRYLEDVPNIEIAQRLGTSQAVVAATLFRARWQLKRELQRLLQGGHHAR